MQMHEQNLPRYSTIQGSRLPRYSALFSGRAETLDSDYVFQLKNGRGKAWASLSLVREGTSSNGKNVPVYFDSVVGSVDLSLDTPETIQAIKLAVRGRAITGANEGGTYTFLDHSLTLWAKDRGDPHAPNSSSKSGKLCGDYSFPFSFTFPTGSDEPHRTQSALPQSFHERGSGVRVQYDLVLHIARGRLRADQKLQAPVLYFRKTRPPAFSPLRQLAYRESTPLPGPDIDPYGWVPFSPVDCVGRLLNSRTVVLRCTLSLANPLSYTRGSVIPCRLAVASVDEQALDFLASPKTSVLKLCRRIRYLHDAGQGMQQNRQSLASTPRYEVSDLSQAVWRHQTSVHEQGVRHLEGEIHLTKDLAPSSDIVPFAVEYTVALFPFESAAFFPTETELLLTQKVEIVTEYAEGPAPRAYLQPRRRESVLASVNNDAAIREYHENPFQLIGTS